MESINLLLFGGSNLNSNTLRKTPNLSMVPFSPCHAHYEFVHSDSIPFEIEEASAGDVFSTRDLFQFPLTVSLTLMNVLIQCCHEQFF